MQKIEVMHISKEMLSENYLYTIQINKNLED